MPIITVKEASAASAVGTNLMAGNREQTKGRIRRVSKIGVTGAVNPGTASVDLYYGSTYIGTFFNTTGGAVVPVESKDFFAVPAQLAAEAGEPINVLISAVSATNPLAVTLVIIEY